MNSIFGFSVHGANCGFYLSPTCCYGRNVEWIVWAKVWERKTRDCELPKVWERRTKDCKLPKVWERKTRDGELPKVWERKTKDCELPKCERERKNCFKFVVLHLMFLFHTVLQGKPKSNQGGNTTNNNYKCFKHSWSGLLLSPALWPLPFFSRTNSPQLVTLTSTSGWLRASVGSCSIFFTTSTPLNTWPNTTWTLQNGVFHKRHWPPSLI